MSLSGTQFQQSIESTVRLREYFSQIVPQVGQIWLEIRYIICAVAALHRRIKYGDQPGQQNLGTVFLRYESKAIHLLSILKDTSTFEVILLACPIIALCELMQHNFENTIRHLQSGLKILQQAQQAQSIQSPTYRLLNDYFRIILPVLLDDAERAFALWCEQSPCSYSS